MVKKKTEGHTALKSRGDSLAVGTYLQSGSAPRSPGYIYIYFGCVGADNAIELMLEVFQICFSPTNILYSYRLFG